MSSAAATKRTRGGATSRDRGPPAAASTSRNRNPLNARNPVPSGRGPLARGGPRLRLVASAHSSCDDFSGPHDLLADPALDPSGHACVMLNSADEGGMRPREWRDRERLTAVRMDLLR